MSFKIYSDFERNEPEAAKEIYKRLPRQMLVTNNLQYGLHEEAKTTGVRRRYIQVNHQNLTKMMVFDIDNSIDLYDWKYLDIPMPNILVINPKNNHAHMIYLLENTNFVCTSGNGRLKDILMYRAIYKEICTRLNADPRYVQKIMKNPFHNSWNTKVLHEDNYSFEDFAKYVDLSSIKDSKSQAKRTQESLFRQMEGRNCSVFEQTRFFAYRAIRECNYAGTQEDIKRFTDQVADYAATVNNGFELPLGTNELKATVKSITKWTMQHFSSASDTEFEKKDIWGDKSREKSISKRSQLKKENIIKAANLKKQGKTIPQIMAELKKSRRTVEYYLNEYKKYQKTAEQLKKNAEEFRKMLFQWISVQFVISDELGLVDSIAMYKLFDTLFVGLFFILL